VEYTTKAFPSYVLTMSANCIKIKESKPAILMYLLGFVMLGKG